MESRLVGIDDQSIRKYKGVLRFSHDSTNPGSKGLRTSLNLELQ
jgi:hypothetical protein